MSSKPFNPVSTSGIGFKLEHYVQTSYLASMVLGTPVPFTDNLLISELLFQAKHVGETDDLIVHLTKGTANYKHYLQAKKGFEINKNETFDKVIKAAYEDFEKTGFSKKHDKFIVFTDTLSKTDADDALTMLEWARFSKSATDFFQKLSLNKAKANKYNYFKDSLNTAAGKTLTQDEIWHFLKCFYVKTNDYLSSGSKDVDVLKWFIKPYLKPENTPEQALYKLLDFIVTSNQHGASLNVAGVPEEIKDIFDLTLTDKIGPELKELFKKSSGLIDAIDNTIDDFHLSRDNYIDQINEAINQSGFVVLTGDGGVGKSAIIKEYLNIAYHNGTGFISIKADILDKSTLAQAMSEIGVHIDMETIIAQWIHLPRLIIYIDSFEKLYESNYSEAFIELLKKIKGKSNITILATCRTYAFETLRKKFKVLSSEIINIPVHPLTKEELEEVEKAKPQLQKLIQNPKLHKVLSLPYYLDQALRLTESLTETDNISESDFKNAVWEQGVEKKGTGRTGHSKKRGLVFSKIILKRAFEKRSFIACEEADLEIAEELYNEGLLVKHPKNESYAPKHDILEDIVIGKFLDKAFDEKVSTKAFIESIDTNPVMRRGLRAWIQDLVLARPDEAKIFLKETFELYTGNASIIDELLVGILGSEDCYTLLITNQELILANDLRLFYRLFHLLKVAYTMPYFGDPKRDIKSIGPGWNALVDFLNSHYAKNTDGFDIIVLDLFKHWILQFEIDEELPGSAQNIAHFCLSKLKSLTTTRSILNVKEVLEVLFFVIPAVVDEMREFLQKAVETVKAKATPTDFPINFYRKLNEMLLIETYKCVKVYKYFPDEIIALAKIEWYSDKIPRDYSSDYQESSFGLTSYPYKYFNASAFQTPLRYLLKYHFETALDFIIELTNRGMEFYVRSDYAKDVAEILITLNDGTVVKQLGNESLFSTYRGSGPIPDLVQSILMALEAALLEKAAQGEDLSPLFLHALKSSHSVVLTGVFVSIGIAYPFSMGREVDALLKVKAFFRWDLTRYSTDFSGFNSSAIGNDHYYTTERIISNQLKHRKEHLETLVAKLQLYRFADISAIIDIHLQAANPKDQLWKLALIRMDMRNTEPELIEEEETQKIAFIPKPLPSDIQKMLDESNKDQHHDTNAISIFLYGEKLFKGELGEAPSVDEWRENYQKLLAIDFSKVAMFRSPDISFATGGIKYFSDELLPEEMEFCVKIVFTQYQQGVTNLMEGNRQGFVLAEGKSVYNILPKLLAPELKDFVDQQQIKEAILDLLLLGHHDQKTELIAGIKNWLWELDNEFAIKCFQTCLKNSISESVSSQLHQIDPLPDDRVKIIEQLIDDIINLPDITPDKLSILAVNKYKLVEALELLPFDILAGEYYSYLETVILQLSYIKDLDDYDEHEFVSKLELLISYFLLSGTNENTTKTVYLLLLITSKTHFKFIVKIFDWVIAIGHDRNYPETLWDHFFTIWHVITSKDPKIGFIQIVLLYSLKYPETANKLSITGSNRVLHETIISNPGMADRNIISSVFQLLSGIGSVYQPESLKWLLASIPAYESYITITNAQTIPYFEKYVIQLYENHIDHIKINKDLLNYYIMLLNVLVAFGSREAFRIRDIII